MCSSTLPPQHVYCNSFDKPWEKTSPRIDKKNIKVFHTTCAKQMCLVFCPILMVSVPHGGSCCANLLPDWVISVWLFIFQFKSALKLFMPNSGVLLFSVYSGLTASLGLDDKLKRGAVGVMPSHLLLRSFQAGGIWPGVEKIKHKKPYPLPWCFQGNG